MANQSNLVKIPLEQILTDEGIEYKTNRRSLILKHCPDCGRSSYSVWMFRPEEGTNRTGGSCWKCGSKFSTYTYFVKSGYEPDDARKTLGIGRHSPDLHPDSWNLPDFNVASEIAEQLVTMTESKPIPDHFMKVRDWPYHPAGKYARSRGIVGELADVIYIDPLSNAVAFPVTSNGIHVGFQRRYVNPINNMKVKTDSGIPKSRSFITVGTPTQQICVVEGPADAVAAAWFGYYGVATMGASVTKSQAQEIAMMAMEQNSDNPIVFIGFDKDDAGEIGARNLARYLDAYGINFFKIKPCGEYKDFGDALIKGSGLDWTTQDVFLNIDGLVELEGHWHWSTQMLEGFRFKIGTDYTWQDFKEVKRNHDDRRRNQLETIKKEDPERHAEIIKKIEQRKKERTRVLKIEGLLD